MPQRLCVDAQSVVGGDHAVGGGSGDGDVGGDYAGDGATAADRFCAVAIPGVVRCSETKNAHWPLEVLLQAMYRHTQFDFSAETSKPT